VTRIARVASRFARALTGPWPLYPRAMALVALYGLFVSAGSRTQVLSESVGEFLAIVWPQWIGVVLASCGVGLALWVAGGLVGRLSPRCRPQACRPAYLAAVLIAAAMSSVAIVGITWAAAGPELRASLPPLHVRFIINLPVVLVVILVANGVIAAVRERLARQETVLAERLVEVRSERTLLLQAEEHVRAQASMTLHNDIQAGLLRAAVRLEALRPALDEEQQRVFDAAIDEIEAVREVRVRALSRVLSPDLGSIGLLQALEELAALYRDVMPTTIEADEAVRERFRPLGDQDELALALYRIAEQALLNALKHGRASHVRMVLGLVGDGSVRLVVLARGAQPTRSAGAGTGTATINAWLDVVGGSWSIEPTSDGSAMTAVVGRASARGA